MNIIARLEYELAYYDSAVHRFNHYTTRTPQVRSRYLSFFSHSFSFFLWQPKVNIIARLEYELAYYDSAVHRFNHYTTRTPQVRSRYLSFFSHSFSFFLWSAGTAKSTILQAHFFAVDYYRSVWPFSIVSPRLGDPFVCQSPIRVCVS